MLRSLTQLNQFDPLQLIFIEELKGELERFLEKAKAKVERATKIVEKKNIIINEYYSFLELKGSGLIHELVLISTSPDFKISIAIDNKSVDWNYSELLELSAYIDTITAVPMDNGQYVFRLSSISFTSLFSLEIYGKNITLAKAYAKFDLFEK